MGKTSKDGLEGMELTRLRNQDGQDDTPGYLSQKAGTHGGVRLNYICSRTNWSQSQGGGMARNHMSLVCMHIKE
jgi:hypothetical protein